MTEQARTSLDAIELLMQDHRELESLFSEFEYLEKAGKETAHVIERACVELKMHDALENELFYPAVSDAGGEEEIEALLDDAEDAHDRALDRIEQVQEFDTDAQARNAHFKMLAEEMKQHILQEEADLFRKVKKIKRLDLALLGARMKARRDELMQGGGLAQASEAGA